MSLIEKCALGLVLLFLLVACLRLLRQPLKLALRVLINSALGFCALWLLNLTTAVTGMSLGLNLFNALTIGVLGVPGLGLLLLLSELITPLRGMMMWQSFSNFGSWMTFGAWIVFAALVVFALEAIVVWEKTAGALAKRIKGFDGYAPKLARALGVVSCVLGFCVAVYTGILLMSAPGVPLWNTLLLPCLFTVSALDTGVALVEVIALANRKKAALSKETNRILEYAVVALVVLELAVLALLLVSMAGSPVQESHEAAVAAQSAALIIGGDLALPFWAHSCAEGRITSLA